MDVNWVFNFSIYIFFIVFSPFFEYFFIKNEIDFCFYFYFYFFLFIHNELVPLVANFCHTKMSFLPFKIESADFVWCVENSFECSFIFTVGYAFCLLHCAVQSINCVDEFFWKYANIDKSCIRNFIVEFVWKPLSSVLIHCPKMVKWIGAAWI